MERLVTSMKSDKKNIINKIITIIDIIILRSFLVNV